MPVVIVERLALVSGDKFLRYGWFYLFLRPWRTVRRGFHQVMLRLRFGRHLLAVQPVVRVIFVLRFLFFALLAQLFIGLGVDLFLFRFA